MSRKEYILLLDSGLGGLSIYSNLIEAFPHENFIYIADTVYFPYGNKSPTEIYERLYELFDAISAYSIKLVVLACHTVSAVVLDVIHSFPFPVIDVIRPCLDVAAKLSQNRQLALMATDLTCSHKAYSDEVNKRELILVSLFPASNIVKQIENLQWEKINLSHNEWHKADTLILGCTHFYFIKDKVKKHFKGFIVEASAVIFDYISPYIKKRNFDLKGERLLFTTGNDVEFQKKLNQLYDKPLTVQVLETKRFVRSNI